ncbi:MAG: hypothetical protein LBS91_00495 [Clostridiales Family XIII bacterium]|nr:hypothetical protein [Clostridiales Family XIII bacterium]
MSKFLTQIFGSIRARFIGLYSRFAIFTNIQWWKTTGLNKLRDFFTKLFDVKPKDKNDYYSIFRWLVSKKLAYALVVIVGVVSLAYILLYSPVAVTEKAAGNDTLPVYRYNAIPLRFFDGVARVKAKDGHIAFEGQIERGVVKGAGQLFAADGAVIYEGLFDSNMYNGAGKLFFAEGSLRYEGEFKSNLFDGTGKLYRRNGSLEYEGEFLRGMKSGAGTLYNASDAVVFEGGFAMDEILYGDFIGKTAQEAADMYKGAQTVYIADDEYAVHMGEISALYTVMDGTNALDGEWKILDVTVLKDSIMLDGEAYATIGRLSSYFGIPDYRGYTYATLSDAAAANALGENNLFGPVDMDMAQTFDGIVNVSDYDRNFEFYVYAFQKDGLMYTFYAPQAEGKTFAMYRIEAAG